eukprot:7435-Heterococcus_DN1.PRE.2
MLRNMKTGADAGPAPQFVKESSELLATAPAYDVVICGGTLGIFMATALQLKGWNVAVVERGALAGRQQEWNISEQELSSNARLLCMCLPLYDWCCCAELEEIVAEGILDQSEMADVIGIRFNPLRAGFKRAEGDPNGCDTYARDCLNLGVKPDMLIQKARARFESAGGTVLENTSITGITVRPNGAEISIASDSPLTARLVLDCMGNGSPLVRQMRWGRKPEGSCARGFDPAKNTGGDIIYANSPVIKSSDNGDVGIQYFWEAFPAGSGPADRTTYMFQYLDADPARPSLLSMMEDYWQLMPAYQNVTLEELEVRRVLFGSFPTYKDSPLKTQWSRICQIGDAGGAQSPLSFGGFACLTRHVRRLTSAFNDALEADLLQKNDLRRINSYLPSLSATWMFQKSMSVGIGERVNKNLIVDLLSNNFKSMNKLGDTTLKPFLQDVVQFVPLSKILLGVTFSAPLSIPPLLLHVGPVPLLTWMYHFTQVR